MKLGIFYFILAVLLLAFPTLANRYDGYSGEYLVAFKMKPGGYFENAVIYIVDHKFMGAQGFVLGNRVVPNSGVTMPGDAKAFVESNIPIFEGGPVNKDKGLLLLTHLISDEGDPNWQAHDYRAFKQSYKGDLESEIIRSYKEDPYPKYWLFMGYSGWVTAQLELEVFSGSWLVTDKLELGLNEMLGQDADAIWHKAYKETSEEENKKLGKIY